MLWEDLAVSLSEAKGRRTRSCAVSAVLLELDPPWTVIRSALVMLSIVIPSLTRSRAHSEIMTKFSLVLSGSGVSAHSHKCLLEPFVVGRISSTNALNADEEGKEDAKNHVGVECDIEFGSYLCFMED